MERIANGDNLLTTHLIKKNVYMEKKDYFKLFKLKFSLTISLVFVLDQLCKKVLNIYKFKESNMMKLKLLTINSNDAKKYIIFSLYNKYLRILESELKEYNYAEMNRIASKFESLLFSNRGEYIYGEKI